MLVRVSILIKCHDQNKLKNKERVHSILKLVVQHPGKSKQGTQGRNPKVVMDPEAMEMLLTGLLPMPYSYSTQGHQYRGDTDSLPCRKL